MKSHIIYTTVFLGILGFFSTCYADLEYTPSPVRGFSKASITAGVGGSNGSLLLLAYGFRPVGIQSSILVENGSDLVMTVTPPLSFEESTAAAIEGKLLNYPNPFRADKGTTIGYVLSKSMDVELKVFDMMGNLVTSIQRPAGAWGGLRGLNKIPISSYDFGGTLLSAGVYFYLLISDGNVLGKGKMAVIP
jgi:hypothetical protein